MPMTTSVEAFHYAVSSRKGSSTRKPMEDTHKTMTMTIDTLEQDPKQAEDVSLLVYLRVMVVAKLQTSLLKILVPTYWTQ